VQLENLWQYMQVDMEADKFEAQMRQSENRQKLIKNRNFLMEQQNNMKKIEGDVAAMQDRLEAVRDEAVRLEGLLTAACEEIEKNPPTTEDEVAQKMESVKKLSEALSRYEQELQKMRKDADVRDRQQKEIRVRAAKAKQEFDQTKAVYDAEFKRDSAALAEMRAKTDAEAGKVDEALLKRYKEIKQHCTPPMAKLIEGQCSGCFMALPSATLRKLATETGVVECDNCGRILFEVK